MTSPELMTGLGAALSIFLSSMGACCASVPAGMYAMRASGITSFFPIIISGVLAIYGTIISVILSQKYAEADEITSKDGYRYFAAGLTVGLACLASGLGLAHFFLWNICPKMMMMSKCHGHGCGRGRGHGHGHCAANEQEQPLIEGDSSQQHEELAPPDIRFNMVMVFLEAIGLYGLITALILSS